MPPRGVRKGTKPARQYQKIKSSARKRGASSSRAKEMAARTVNKSKARAGQTKEQLYSKAKRLKIDGRSSMNKSQLQRAVAAKSR
jgi:hypothetical protein